MEINYYLDQVVLNWLRNINKLKSFEYIFGKDYSDIKEVIPIIFLEIRDDKKTFVSVQIKLDGISNPEIYFDNNKDLYFRYLGDTSIYLELEKLAIKYKDIICESD